MTRRHEFSAQWLSERVTRNESTGCDEWNGRRDQKGYGWVDFHGRSHRAHRFIWYQANGTTEMHVLHKCDNPCCVRLDHLFLGTNDDNVADKVAKGRQSRGDRHSQKQQHGDDHWSRRDTARVARGSRAGASKTCEGNVRVMRMLLAEGFTLVEVGDVFNLTFQTVSQIKLGKTWRHV